MVVRVIIDSSPKFFVWVGSESDHGTPFSSHAAHGTGPASVCDSVTKRHLHLKIVTSKFHLSLVAGGIAPPLLLIIVICTTTCVNTVTCIQTTTLILQYFTNVHVATYNSILYHIYVHTTPPECYMASIYAGYLRACSAIYRTEYACTSHHAVTVHVSYNYFVY